MKWKQTFKSDARIQADITLSAFNTEFQDPFL